MHNEQTYVRVRGHIYRGAYIILLSNLIDYTTLIYYASMRHIYGCMRTHMCPHTAVVCVLIQPIYRSMRTASRGCSSLIDSSRAVAACRKLQAACCMLLLLRSPRYIIVLSNLSNLIDSSRAVAACRKLHAACCCCRCSPTAASAQVVCVVSV